MNNSWRRIRFLAIVIAGGLLLLTSFSPNSPAAKQMQNVVVVLIGGFVFLQLFLFVKSFFSDRKAKLLREGMQNQSAQTLGGLFLTKKTTESSVAYLFLVASLFVSSYLTLLEIIPVRIEVFLFISAFIVANFVRQKTLEYRIKKGFLGTNEYEAREIISFILNTNRSEITKRRGGKGVFPVSAEELIPDSETLMTQRGGEL